MSSKKGKNLLDEVKDILYKKNLKVSLKEEVNAIRAHKGDFIIIKSPLIPLFQRGRPEKSNDNN
ncbi:MAG: hypothetical protein ACC630_00015 [Nitrospinota bacterium]